MVRWAAMTRLAIHLEKVIVSVVSLVAMLQGAFAQSTNANCTTLKWVCELNFGCRRGSIDQARIS